MTGSQRLIHCLIFAIIFLTYVFAIPARSEERLSVSYAALGGANSIWNIAKDAGFYKKHGLNVDVVYIASTTLSAAAVLSGHIQVGWSRESG